MQVLGDDWEPIGGINGFDGKFSGEGRTISDLVINRPDMEAVGLFAAVVDGEILGVGLVNVDVIGGFAVGALAGIVQGGTIVNSYSDGSVSGSSNVGGLVGNFEFSNMNNCSSLGSVFGSGHTVGGLIARKYHSNLRDSFSDVDVVGESDRVGGLIGYNGGNMDSEIFASYALGNVRGADYVGGLVGYEDYSQTTFSYSQGDVTGNNYVGGMIGGGGGPRLSSSYSKGEVTGNDYVGGIAGANYVMDLSDSYSWSNIIGVSYVGGAFGYAGYGIGIRNVYSKGSVTGSSDVGGFLGAKEENTIISNSFYDSETAGQSDDDARGIPKTTAEMKDILTFSTATWDIVAIRDYVDEIWKIDNRDDYPILGYEFAGEEEDPEEEVEIDLSVRYIKPIQVIEDADSNNNGKIDFVQKKPAMVRVKVDIEGIGETQAIDVDVKLEIYHLKSLWANIPFSFEKSLELVWNDTQTKSLKKEYSLVEIKKGQETVNFFVSAKQEDKLPWLPIAGKEYVIVATVDPDNKIEEADENNNNMSSKTIEVGRNKKGKIPFFIIYNVSIIDRRAGKIYTIVERSKENAKDNVEFLMLVYPFRPYERGRRLIHEYVGTFRYVYNSRTPISRADEDKLRDIRIDISDDIRRRTKRLGFFPILIMPHKLMDQAQGYHYDGVIMLSDTQMDGATLAHEYGHYMGLYRGGNEQYDTTLHDGDASIGKLSAPGWCLNPDGTDCTESRIGTGRKINIYDSDSNQKEVVFYNEIIWKTDENNHNEMITLGPRYYDIMGNANVDNTWMYNNTYHHLLDKLVDFDGNRRRN
jgi:hypothetical protein